jgi:phage gp36-like protein
MAYATIDDLKALIPPAFVTQALDDDGDGAADPGLFDSIAVVVGDSIDGQLRGRYPTPFLEPIPPLVKDCARIFIAERLYDRRGFTADKNPWLKRANKLRDQLEAIRTRKQDLAFDEAPAKPPVSAVTQPNKIHSKTGLAMT